MRKLLLITICFAVALMFSGVAYGFHDEGVARCSGCHTMHNSQNGVPVDTGHVNGNAYLLIKSTPSDVCLSCHGDGHGNEFPSATYTVTTPPPQTAAGSFIFLLEDNIYDGRTGTQPGGRGGHNLNAPSRGVSSDATLTSAPGGTFPSSAMGCSSCHDPHGNTNFRMLYGAGGVVQDGIATFANAAPDAEGLSYDATETNTSHTAYHGGMSAWCGNCHGNFHNEAGGRLEHPSGENLGGTISGNYGRYNGTAHYNSGTPATSYLAAVPFEDPANTTSSTAGPSASSQVSCITCHRAHASSAPDIGRWDFNVTWLSDDGVKSGSYPIPNPYGPDVHVQRSLCNKCHVKDAGDADSAP
jgi:hypothetical protein